MPPKCTYKLPFATPENTEPSPVPFTDKLIDLPYSSKRLNMCAKELRGKHITDAFAAIEKMDKKGGPYCKQLLQKVKDIGIEKGLNPDLFYVHEAIVGRGIKSKKIDIKARGKMGIITSPKSSLRIVMHEKPIQHMIKEAIVGQAPPGIGEVFRRRLWENNANFEDVRKYR